MLGVDLIRRIFELLLSQLLWKLWNHVVFVCARLPQFCRHRSYSEPKRKLWQGGHSKIILTVKSRAVDWSTEVHFTSFLSGGFTTMAVVNSPQCGLLFNSWAFYYSILEHFGGATNQDATNLRHVIIAMYSNQLNKSPKIMHKRLDEWGNVGSLFAKSIQNWS